MAKHYTKKNTNQNDYTLKRSKIPPEQSKQQPLKAPKNDIGWIIFLIAVFFAVYLAMRYLVFK